MEDDGLVWRLTTLTTGTKQLERFSGGEQKENMEDSTQTQVTYGGKSPF